MIFFLKGFLIGFSIAAPVGPIGLLCIQRTLNYGRLSGFMTGLGAATADAIYGSIAGFGLTFLSNLLLHQLIGLRWIGGIFLIYLGIHIFFRKPESPSHSLTKIAMVKIYSSTFLLTLTNPTTILSFAAIYLGLGMINPSSNYGTAGWIVAGVFSGSLFWWFLLSGGIGYFRKKIYPSYLYYINRTAGGIIIILGLTAIFSTVYRFI